MPSQSRPVRKRKAKVPFSPSENTQGQGDFSYPISPDIRVLEESFPPSPSPVFKQPIHKQSVLDSSFNSPSPYQTKAPVANIFKKNSHVNHSDDMPPVSKTNLQKSESYDDCVLQENLTSLDPAPVHKKCKHKKTCDLVALDNLDSPNVSKRQVKNLPSHISLPQPAPAFDSSFIPVDAHVGTDMRQKIINNVFIDFRKLLETNENSGDESDGGTFSLKDGILKLKQNKQNKADISFTDWVGAWNIFVAIYSDVSEDSEIVNKMSKHLETVRKLLKAGKDWRFYDVKFRHLIESGHASWGSVKGETYNEAFLRDMKAKKTTPSSNVKPKNYAKGVCFKYQHDLCLYGQACKYLHICQLCHSPSHPFSKCFLTSRRNSQFQDRLPRPYLSNSVRTPTPSFALQQSNLARPRFRGQPQFNRYQNQFSFNANNPLQQRPRLPRSRTQPAITY